MWATLIFGLTAAAFAGMAGAALWHLQWVRRLPSLESLADQGAGTETRKLPRCSVVVAARDEAARIKGMLDHLLAQTGVDAEFIIVDDRSTDRTSDILLQLANHDPRVQVKRVSALPDAR